MKGLSMILTATFLIFTSSCSSTNKYEELGLEYDVKQIIFFSDDANYNYEAPYYDAIIELKREFPEEFKDMMVLSGNKASKYDSLLKVEKQPALVIFYQDKVAVKIHGFVSKDEIIKPITDFLSKDELATTH
ncbi:small peptidoglycan-associated lipoprotein [Mesobacillus maritimus]|uniref:Small peptidoglycan-associated lipoprotein n=1 Tax=Mesobacillus maritimus TaxID=1643336 RepID=A0ABS7K6G0_9BACI|nr:small peptidoglycan-associated lipoprotein [Mesobacillus maritimus]MBY0097725.1 small peptidoglycan-associated lipoprotein [Mesobacillus maritimus]